MKRLALSMFLIVLVVVMTVMIVATPISTVPLAGPELVTATVVTDVAPTGVFFISKTASVSEPVDSFAAVVVVCLLGIVFTTIGLRFKLGVLGTLTMVPEA